MAKQSSEPPQAEAAEKRTAKASRSPSRVLFVLLPVLVALLGGLWASLAPLETDAGGLLEGSNATATSNTQPLVDKYASEVVHITTQKLLSPTTQGDAECPDFQAESATRTHVEEVLGRASQLQHDNRVFLMLNGENDGFFFPWTSRDDDTCLYELTLAAALQLGMDEALVSPGLKLLSVDGLPIANTRELQEQRVAHVLLDGQLWVWPGIKVGYVRQIEGCTVTTQSLHPKVFTVEGFFTVEEADAIISEGLNKLSRSPVDSPEAVNGMHSDRTSYTAFLSDSAFTRDFRVRSAKVARLPSPGYTERMQLVRYETGQFFRKHEDYFNSKEFQPTTELARREYEVWTHWAAAKIEALRETGGDEALPEPFRPGGDMFPDAQSTTTFQQKLLSAFMEDAEAQEFFWEHADVEWGKWIRENLDLEANDILGPLLKSKGYMLPYIIKSWEKRVQRPELEYDFPKRSPSGVSHYFRWIRWAKERVQFLLDTQPNAVASNVAPEGADYPTFYSSFQNRLTGYILQDYSKDELVSQFSDEWFHWLVENHDHTDSLLEALRSSPRVFDLAVEVWTKRAGEAFAYEKPMYFHHFEPNRFATLFLYLNECPEGGETVFPYSKERLVTGIEREGMAECSEGLAVPPVKLTASLFYSQTPMNDPEPASLHGGCPPAKGIKFGANSFMWNADADEGANAWGLGMDYKLESVQVKS